jgi:Na+-translocating ferredoxin:NAD+ oxidoreductase RNF subunit RnfB
VGNSSMPRAMEHFCHCCGCGCLALVRRIQSGEVRRLLSPSRFLAKMHRETCNGCQDCVERCYFNAIEMAKAPGAKKLKATIDAEQCMGCGQCASACSVDAIEMECVRLPEHIPSEFHIPSELLHEHHS